MGNRNCVKQFFITFPNSSGVCTKETFLSCVWTDTQLDSFCVVEEHHESGEPHLHANIKLKYGMPKQKVLKKMERCFPNDYKRIDVRPTRETPDKARQGYLSKEGSPEDCFYKKDLRGKRNFLEWLIYAGNKRGFNLVEQCMFNERYAELRDLNEAWRKRWKFEEGIEDDEGVDAYYRFCFTNRNYIGWWCKKGNNAYHRQ